jgi:hypothetical protein
MVHALLHHILGTSIDRSAPHPQTFSNMAALSVVAIIVHAFDKNPPDIGTANVDGLEVNEQRSAPNIFSPRNPDSGAMLLIKAKMIDNSETNLAARHLFLLRFWSAPIV